MIRVVARHIENTSQEAVLIGDFPPSEVAALLDLFGNNTVHIGEYANTDEVKVVATQFYPTRSHSPRLVYELICE